MEPMMVLIFLAGSSVFVFDYSTWVRLMRRKTQFFGILAFFFAPFNQIKKLSNVSKVDDKISD
jgi:hypothetical protein